MPTSRARFGLTVCQNKIYCIGGLTESGLTGANEVFDPATTSWSTKASVPNPLYPMLVSAVDDKIYVMGADGNGGLENLQMYDPQTDSWTVKSAPPNEIISWTSTAIGNKIYVLAIDGFNVDSQGNVLSAKPPFVQIYDTEHDTWSRLGVAPTYGATAVSAPTSGLCAPKGIYFFEGAATYVYDPSNDTWTTGAPMSSGIPFGFGVGVVNYVFHVVGGRVGQHDLFVFMDPSAVNELYIPIGYGALRPVVSVVSPENKTYADSGVSLTFTVDVPVSWVSYSLDGQDNVSVAGNSTLANLPNGEHNLTVYAKYSQGSIGASKNTAFSIAKQEPLPTVTAPFAIVEQEPFPTAIVTSVAGASIAILAMGLFYYYKKRKP
jgi:hypothetical protein